MLDATKDLRAALEMDAARRSAAASVPVETDERPVSMSLCLRLMNAFPRETRATLTDVVSELVPYGYILSPLHRRSDPHHIQMQTELGRVAADDPTQYAPLIFELEPGSSSLRAYVRQSGGQAAPDFGERHVDFDVATDISAFKAALVDYVRCMINRVRPQNGAAINCRSLEMI